MYVSEAVILLPLLMVLIYGTVADTAHTDCVETSQPLLSDSVYTSSVVTRVLPCCQGAETFSESKLLYMGATASWHRGIG